MVYRHGLCRSAIHLGKDDGNEATRSNWDHRLPRLVFRVDGRGGRVLKPGGAMFIYSRRIGRTTLLYT